MRTNDTGLYQNPIRQGDNMIDIIDQYYILHGFIDSHNELFWESGGIYIYWNDTWETIMLRSQQKQEMS